MWVNVSPELLERVKTSLSYSAVKTNQLTHAANLRDFMEAVSEFNEKRTPAEEKLFQIAKSHESPGELEFDDDAVVSTAEGGDVYVMGWFGVNTKKLREKTDEPDRAGSPAKPVSGVRTDRADI